MLYVPGVNQISPLFFMFRNDMKILRIDLLLKKNFQSLSNIILSSIQFFDLEIDGHLISYILTFDIQHCLLSCPYFKGRHSESCFLKTFRDFTTTM